MVHTCMYVLRCGTYVCMKEIPDNLRDAVIFSRNMHITSLWCSLVLATYLINVGFVLPTPSKIETYIHSCTYMYMYTVYLGSKASATLYLKQWIGLGGVDNQPIVMHNKSKYCRVKVYLGDKRPAIYWQSLVHSEILVHTVK